MQMRQHQMKTQGTKCSLKALLAGYLMRQHSNIMTKA
jgi:hypothetical protein